MIFIPIRTESEIVRTPYANYSLIGVHVIMFALFSSPLAGEQLLSFRDARLVLATGDLNLLNFFTYQFLHADILHLAGNMLFLWVFGNSVNSKMGDWPYLFFYLAGGIFGGAVYSLLRPAGATLIGASGAIASITTAYLALFPRSHVTVLIWIFVFLQFVEVPAMVLICLKIIVWDNIVAPTFGGVGRVAHDTHLAGYLFGFIGAMGMLWLRALPRDQFDMVALWDRWRRRREMAAAFRGAAPVTGSFGSVARKEPTRQDARRTEDQQLDRIASLRDQVGEAIRRGDISSAMNEYAALLAADPAQILAEGMLLQIARRQFETGAAAAAAETFERVLAGYPRSPEAENVRLLLGIMYARDLARYDKADEHLTRSWESLTDPDRRAKCHEWLTKARQALGKTMPNPSAGGAVAS